MSRKTERLYASEGLVGDDIATTAKSLTAALAKLQASAVANGREVLFDTLDISIDRDYALERSLMGDTVSATYVTITLSADCVKVSETTTKE